MATALIRLALRSSTAAQWTAANPVLELGEEGYETDTGKRKVGDGTSAWTALPYNGSTPGAATARGSAYSPMASGQFTGPAAAGARGTVAMTSSRMLLLPIFLPTDSPDVDAMAIEVTTAGAGSSVRLGLYERTSASSLAMSLVKDFGTVDSSVTGLRTSAASPTVAAGKRLYVAAAAQGGTAPTLRNFTQYAFGVPAVDPSGTGNPVAFRVDSVDGALPGTVTPTLVSNTAPVIWVRGQ